MVKRTAAETPETTPEAGPGWPLEGIADARVRLGEIADEARYLDRVTLLGKRGKPVAAVVPVEAARSRAQLQQDAQISTADLAALTARYERTERAAEATLEAREVMWIRAYLRVWEVLNEVCADFGAAVGGGVGGRGSRRPGAGGAQGRKPGVVARQDPRLVRRQVRGLRRVPLRPLGAGREAQGRPG